MAFGVDKRIAGSRFPCSTILSLTIFLASPKFVCQSMPNASAPLLACLSSHWPPPLLKMILGISSKPIKFKLAIITFI